MQYLNEFEKALKNTKITPDSGNAMDYEAGMKALFEYFYDIKIGRRGLFICGNGGSAGIAIHMTADFLKNGGFNVRSLMNSSVLTCLGNDLSYEYIFCKQIEMMAAKDDVLVAISSSGKSPNIIRAAETMKQMGGEIITFTGFDEKNPLSGMGKFNVHVPISHYGIVESIHNLMLQQLVDEIVERDGVAMAGVDR